MFAAVQRLRRLSLPPSPHPLIASSAVTLWRSLRFSWEADAPLATIYLLLIAVGGAIPVATAWTAKLVLDRLVLALGHAHDCAAGTGGLSRCRLVCRSPVRRPAPLYRAVPRPG